MKDICSSKTKTKEKTSKFIVNEERQLIYLRNNAYSDNIMQDK